MTRSDCTVPGCPNRLHHDGLCKSHDYRRKKGHPLTGPIKRVQQHTDCAFDGCNDQAVSRGLCNGHRLQLRDRGFLTPINSHLKKNRYAFTVCTIAGCDRPHRANGMCATHCSRASRYRLSVIQLQMLLLTQNCTICKEELTEQSGAIDHDHKCCPGSRSCGNCVLGIICIRCNAGIGYFVNRPETMSRAIDYLLRTRPM